jgi:hypothetical protein
MELFGDGVPNISDIDKSSFVSGSSSSWVAILSINDPEIPNLLVVIENLRYPSSAHLAHVQIFQWSKTVSLHLPSIEAKLLTVKLWSMAINYVL